MTSILIIISCNRLCFVLRCVVLCCGHSHVYQVFPTRLQTALPAVVPPVGRSFVRSVGRETERAQLSSSRRGCTPVPCPGLGAVKSPLDEALTFYPFLPHQLDSTRLDSTRLNTKSVRHQRQAEKQTESDGFSFIRVMEDPLSTEHSNCKRGSNSW